MSYIEILGFFAILALYLKWNYGSPYVTPPILRKKNFFRRSIPLILFIISGISLTLSLIFGQREWAFYLFFIISAICLILAPIVTYLDRKERPKEGK
jgi:hypothetical protein